MEDPQERLRAVMAEVMALAKKHDVMASVVLSDQSKAYYAMRLADWSVVQPVRGQSCTSSQGSFTMEVPPEEEQARTSLQRTFFSLTAMVNAMRDFGKLIAQVREASIEHLATMGIRVVCDDGSEAEHTGYTAPADTTLN